MRTLRRRAGLLRGEQKPTSPRRSREAPITKEHPMRSPSLRRLGTALLLGAALTATAATAQTAPSPGVQGGPPAGGAAQSSFSEEQRKAIEAIVRDVLVKNPEVLQEAISELERRQQEAQRTAQIKAVQDSRDALHNPARSIIAGNPSGDVTVVEFFDYNCGYCKRTLGDVQALVKADPKVRVLLKEFPVLGPPSVEASRVALAVKQQVNDQRMFEYHAKLLELRGPVNGERALGVAREMGLDMARIQKDMAGPEVQATLQENAAVADKLGLTGTPAFVIGDEVISGAVGAGPLRQAVTGIRQCGRTEC